MIEAFTLIVRWSQGRKGNGADLKGTSRDETLRIVLVVLKSV